MKHQDNLAWWIEAAERRIEQFVATNYPSPVPGEPMAVIVTTNHGQTILDLDDLDLLLAQYRRERLALPPQDENGRVAELMSRMAELYAMLVNMRPLPVPPFDDPSWLQGTSGHNSQAFSPDTDPDPDLDLDLDPDIWGEVLDLL